MALSLTEYTTSAECAIAAGSVAEIAGAFFTFPGDESIEASTWTSITTGTTAYITLTPSGTAGSQIVTAEYTPTVPTWRDDLQGWYTSAASVVRVVGSVYKAEAANYGPKYVINSGQNHKTQGTMEYLTSGAGNWTVPDFVNRIRVTCIGGGGAGGAGGAGYAAGYYGGGGGGGGGTNISLVLGTVMNVIPGSVKAYSVGGAGTSTTFEGAVTGGAGGAGGAGDSGSGSGVGGAGGAPASLGAGGAGGAGGAAAYSNTSVGGRGGTGAGAGGGGGAGANAPSGAGSAGSSGNYGGGGGGGGGGGPYGGAGGAGGAGGSGLIIIEYL